MEIQHKFMKNKIHKKLEKNVRKQGSMYLWKKRCFISYPHVKRNIPRTNTVHMRRVSACSATSWRTKWDCLQYNAQFAILPLFFLPSCFEISGFARSLCALLASSRKALAFGFPVFKPRSYPDYERVLHEECSPPEKLHSRVPWEACIHEDELRYILETYGDTRHGYRSLYPVSARRRKTRK